jgi:hypothetical protein
MSVLFVLGEKVSCPRFGEKDEEEYFGIFFTLFLVDGDSMLKEARS